MLQVITRPFNVTAVSAAIFGFSSLAAAETASPATAASALIFGIRSLAAAEAASQTAAAAKTASPTAAASGATPTSADDAANADESGASTMKVISGSSTIQTAALAPEADDEIATEQRYLENRRQGLWMASGLDLFVPAGSFDDAGTVALSDVASTTGALGFVFGYKFSPYFAVGGFFDYAMGAISDDLAPNCDDVDASCTYYAARYGAVARYTVNPQDFVASWFSVGLGWSVLGATAKLAEAPLIVISANGKELVAKGGINLGMQSGRSNVDVYVSASVGTWDELRVATPQTGSNTTRDGLGTYHWLGLGAAFNY